MGTPIKSAAPIIEGLTDEEVADAFALRLLDPDGPNVGRRVWAALEQIPVLKARLAALEADARRYQKRREEEYWKLQKALPVGESISREAHALSYDAHSDWIKSPILDAALSQEPGGK